MKTLATIGHRNNLLKKYDIQKIRDYYQSTLTEYRPDKIITSLSPGADMEFAKIARQNSIPYEAHIPYRGYSRSFSSDLKEEYNELLKYATETIYSFKRFDPTKLRLHYFKVVGLCSNVVFVWDRSKGFVANQIATQDKEKFLSIFDLKTYQTVKLS